MNDTARLGQRLNASQENDSGLTQMDDCIERLQTMKGRCTLSSFLMPYSPK
jgi:hypothetical protein